MNRRNFINSMIGASAALPFWQRPTWAHATGASQLERKLAVPTPEQAAWQDLEIGMFVHFAPNTWQDKEGDDLSTPLSAINPAQLDTDQWAECALGLGAKYIVFVAKHHGRVLHVANRNHDLWHSEYALAKRERRCHGRLGALLPEARAEAGSLSLSPR